tara:strand:- start:213 stop:434 length:222 start_codon:yes stop_codon:yes gene_type:complete
LATALLLLVVIHEVQMVMIQFLVPLLPQVVEAADLEEVDMAETAALAVVRLVMEAILAAQELLVKEMMVVVLQ